MTAEQLIIHPHPNADALELAQVGLYHAVVPKDVYATGDWAIYIPEGAVLPDDLIAELGLAGSAPELLPWIEIEDIKRYPGMFKPGEPVVAAEKIHGTACLFTRANEQNYVSSKGYGKKRSAIVYDEANLYWQTVLHYDVPWVASVIANMMHAHKVAIFGEIYGKGV